QMNPAALAKMIQYFDENKMHVNLHAVSHDICVQTNNLKLRMCSAGKRQNMSKILSLKEKRVLCSASSNVIATRPTVVTGENSEHILLFPPGNSPMDTLLNNTDRNNCVVFYSSNSPCVETCIKSTDNIFPGLANWTNVRKEGMNVFVFGKLRKYVGKETGNDFLIINMLMPLYRCTSTNVVECQNCLKDDAVNPFCLPGKKSILLYFQEMLLSVIELFLS
uniref:Uncharacterized protein n=1 Tax=Sinocyclocheilus anshuiensis TaxID=1608454 RepID=A0A671M3V2_9TELE